MISRPVKAETTEELQRSIDEVTRSVELDAVGSVARSRRLCIHLRLRDHFRLRLRVCVRVRNLHAARVQLARVLWYVGMWVSA